MIPRVGELVDGALRAAGLEPASALWRIGAAWTDIVGPRVAARTAPRGLHRGELVIAAPEAVWRQELTLLAPEIVANVNRKLGEEVVRRVRLVSGPLYEPAPPPRRRRLRLPAPSQAPDLAPEPTGASPAPAPRDVAAALDALHRSRIDRLAADRRHGPPRRRGARDHVTGRTGAASRWSGRDRS